VTGRLGSRGGLQAAGQRHTTRQAKELAESTGRPCQLGMTDTQNPTAVAAPASAPPRSNEKGISEFVSIASRRPAARAAARSPRCPREVGGQETEGGGDAAGEDYEQPELAEPPRAPSA
jgi:hypothetical protein